MGWYDYIHVYSPKPKKLSVAKNRRAAHRAAMMNKKYKGRPKAVRMRLLEKQFIAAGASQARRTIFLNLFSFLFWVFIFFKKFGRIKEIIKLKLR